MSVSTEDIDRTLRESLEPVALEVIDDSHLHVGHAGAREGRHFTVLISSHQFAGLTKVAQHRLVYDALRCLMPQGIHALALETRLPGAHI